MVGGSAAALKLIKKVNKNLGDLLEAAAKRKGPAKVGSQIGNFGKLVKRPDINWTSSREHALNQMKKRGITEKQVKSWINNGKVIQQDTNTFMFVTKDGVAILNKQGVLQTAYGKDQFKDPIKDAIKQLYGI